MSREKYQLKQQQKIETKEKERQKRRMKKTAKTVVLILIVTGVIFWGGWYLVSKTADAPGDDLAICIQHARLAMHIHPQLSIMINGQDYEIPADIGISTGCMRPIHTHDATGTLHVEFPRVREVKLGEFFKIWEKIFNADCIFEHCSGGEDQVKMFVNGEQNFDFENYVMRDLDRIEIIYE